MMMSKSILSTRQNVLGFARANVCYSGIDA